MGAKSGYVALVRGARDAARRIGLLDALERSDRRALRYLRTLFAIYDAEDLASLDLPWWSYRAIDAVESFLAARPGARVFEYGSGASTVWLASRAGRVVSVEHDAPFADTVRGLLVGVDHVELRVIQAPVRAPGEPAITSARPGATALDFTGYVASIEEADGPFDLIVVDGRARVESFRTATRHLAPGGLIVFDDVERDRYAAALAEPGFTAQVLRGLTPCVPFPTSTALLRPTAR